MAALEQEGWKGREGDLFDALEISVKIGVPSVGSFRQGSMPDDRWKKIEEKLDQCRGRRKAETRRLRENYVSLAGWEVGGEQPTSTKTS
jgi:hypothetical protein